MVASMGNISSNIPMDKVHQAVETTNSFWISSTTVAKEASPVLMSQNSRFISRRQSTVDCCTF